MNQGIKPGGDIFSTQKGGCLGDPGFACPLTLPHIIKEFCTSFNKFLRVGNFKKTHPPYGNQFQIFPAEQGAQPCAITACPIINTDLGKIGTLFSRLADAKHLYQVVSHEIANMIRGSQVSFPQRSPASSMSTMPSWIQRNTGLLELPLMTI